MKTCMNHPNMKAVGRGKYADLCIDCKIKARGEHVRAYNRARLEKLRASRIEARSRRTTVEAAALIPISTDMSPLRQAVGKMIQAFAKEDEAFDYDCFYAAMRDVAEVYLRKDCL